MRDLRQSTAATVIIGPFVSPADAVTARTALASQAGRIVKNGTGAALSAPGTWSHDAAGYYLVGFGTGDTDTIGRLTVSFADAATYLPVWEHFRVLSAAVYDWLYGTAAPNALSAADSPVVHTGTAQGGTGGYPAHKGITLATTAATVDSLYKGCMVTILSGAGAGQSRCVLWYTGSSREVQVERNWFVDPDNTSVYAILRADISNLDDNLQVISGLVIDKTGYSLATAPPTAATIAAAILATPANLLATDATGRVTVGSNADKGGYSLATAPPTAAAISTQVWGEALPGSFTAGSAGAKLNAAGGAADPWATALPGSYGAGTAGKIVGDNLNATVGSRSTYAGADTAGTTTLLARLTAGRATNLDNLDAAISGLPSAGAVSTQVWTEAIPGSFGAGSAGAKLNAAGAAGDPWSTALPGSYASGTAGKILGDNLDAKVSTRSTYAGGNVTVGGYAAGQDPATLLLTTPANKLATNASGQVPASNLPTDYQQRAVAVTLPTTPPAGYGGASTVVLAANGLDAVMVETGSPTLNARQALAVIASDAVGKWSGSPTSTHLAAGGTATRIVATTDATGRPSVTLTPPA